MRNRIARTVMRRALVIAALLATTSAPAFAHGGGAIHLASNQVAVGGTLVLRGEKLDKNSDIKLELRGILDNYPIGTVHTDTAGVFRATIVLPPHVPAGAYSLVAIAADGDVAARADLTVGALAGASGGAAGAMAGMPGMGAHGTQEMPGMHATKEMMALQRTTTTGEWIVIWTLIIIAFASGALLLRRAAAVTHD